MNTHLHKSVSIDLFNLPPLPDERNTEEPYMDMPNNYYVPDGKNSRLLDRTDRVEFNRETLDGNIWSTFLAPNTLSWTMSQVV